MSSDPNDLRVLIVAADPLARAGLATLLDGQPECAVVGQVAGETDLEAALEVYRPDVAVWDLGWNPEATLERLAESGATGPPVVALVPDEAYTADVRAAGARGLLTRETNAASLAAALQAVAQGLVVLDPTLAEALVPAGDLAPDALVEDLTPRESEVLQLLAQGLPNKTIAHQLGISEHTVKFHVNAIMTKLGAQSRTEAAVRATRLGLVLI